MKYKTKPVEIEAVIWNGKNIKEVLDFMEWRNADHDERNGLFIYTLEGKMQADVGDYIIKGVRGEFYPCKPDAFNWKYEPIK